MLKFVSIEILVYPLSLLATLGFIVGNDIFSRLHKKALPDQNEYSVNETNSTQKIERQAKNRRLRDWIIIIFGAPLALQTIGAIPASYFGLYKSIESFAYEFVPEVAGYFSPSRHAVVPHPSKGNGGHVADYRHVTHPTPPLVVPSIPTRSLPKLKGNSAVPIQNPQSPSPQPGPQTSSVADNIYVTARDTPLLAAPETYGTYLGTIKSGHTVTATQDDQGDPDWLHVQGKNDAGAFVTGYVNRQDVVPQ